MEHTDVGVQGLATPLLNPDTNLPRRGDRERRLQTGLRASGPENLRIAAKPVRHSHHHLNLIPADPRLLVHRSPLRNSMSGPAAVGRCSFMLPAPFTASAPEPPRLQPCSRLHGVHSSKATPLHCSSDRSRHLQAAAQGSTTWSAQHAADDEACGATEHAGWSTAGSGADRRHRTRCRTARMVRPMSFEGHPGAEQASSTPFWLQSAPSSFLFVVDPAIQGNQGCQAGIIKSVYTPVLHRLHYSTSIFDLFWGVRILLSDAHAVLLEADAPLGCLRRDGGLDQREGPPEVALAQRRGARTRRSGSDARATGCAAPTAAPAKHTAA